MVTSILNKSKNNQSTTRDTFARQQSFLTQHLLFLVFKLKNQVEESTSLVKEYLEIANL
jgi:hypothetical protein